MPKKLHWYAATIISVGNGRDVSYDSLTIGFRDRNITAAKYRLLVEKSPKSDVMPVSLVYLGHMTEEEFNAPLPDSW